MRECDFEKAIKLLEVVSKFDNVSLGTYGDVKRLIEECINIVSPAEEENSIPTVSYYCYRNEFNNLSTKLETLSEDEDTEIENPQLTHALFLEKDLRRAKPFYLQTIGDEFTRYDCVSVSGFGEDGTSVKLRKQ